MSAAFRKNMQLLSEYWESLSDRIKLQKNFDLNTIFLHYSIP